MIHPDEDSLLRLQLELIEPDEAKALQEHLAICGSCCKHYLLYEKDIEALREFSLKPIHERYALPRVSQPSLNYWWRAAAIIVVALSVGSIALFEYGRPIQVEPMRLALTPPPDSLVARLSCTAIELRGR